VIVVVKVGTSSLTDDDGVIDVAAVAKITAEVAAVTATGHSVVLVTSGAIAAGLPALGLTARDRPRDPITLQAVAAVGQARLMATYQAQLDALAPSGTAGLLAGQVLVAPSDFGDRRRYLMVRSTINRLLELGVLPVVNENDTVADDEIRYGDNDRIAAMVAQLVGAEVLVLLTDAAGVFTADPRLDTSASLIEEILEVDAELLAAAGGSGSNRGSGGMATKVTAARMAAWSGVRTVIAAADRPDVVAAAVRGDAEVGTTIAARPTPLSSRKVWIGFAVGSSGRIHVDAGAQRALVDRDSSLLAVGVTGSEGNFDGDDAVEICGPDGTAFAKGLVRVSSAELADASGVVVHRDDLVVLPG